MTVENQFPYQSFTANGLQASFALGFYVDDKDHFEVKKNDQLVTKNDYSYNSSSNSIVFNTTPKIGDVIEIKRVTGAERAITYATYNNTFRPETINFDFDRIWRKLQELEVVDWLLDKKDKELKVYTDHKDLILDNKINDLKTYAEQKDQQLKSYLFDEIKRQGVALDQLENYYNYLIKRIAEIATNGGWDANLVAYGNTTQKDFNDKQLQHNERFPSVLDNVKVKGDKHNNDSVGFQEYFTEADLQQKSSIYIPMREKDFKVNEKVILQEPTMIYGDVGATYNRGDGKKGKIIIGETDVAFDLGNSRVRGAAPYELNINAKRTKNPADNWTLKNIAFIQDSSTPVGTKTAIEFTPNTNGPDRGFLIREASATRLKHFLSITNPSAETQLANLVVENSCLSNNVLPLKATGNVLGARIVGNQMEQNTEGAIHGTFNAGVYIADNMLEGQPNPINIEVPPVTGNRPSIFMHRNYFEQNTGDYILNYRGTAGYGLIDSAGNWNLYLKGKDYIRVTTGSPTIINKDPSPITFMARTGACAYGSDFLSYSGINTYKVRFSNASGESINGLSMPITIRHNSELRYPTVKSIQTTTITDSAIAYQSPYGEIRAVNGFVNIPIGNIAVDDIVHIFVYCSINPKLYGKTLVAQVYDNTTTKLLGEVGIAAGYGANSKWALCSLALKSQNVSTGHIRFRFYTTESQENYDEPLVLIGGASAVRGSVDITDPDITIIKPEMPFLKYVNQFPSTDITTTFTWQGSTTDNTEIVVDANIAEATIGDFVLCTASQGNSIIKKITANVLATGKVRLFITPNQTVSNAVISLKIKLIK